MVTGSMTCDLVTESIFENIVPVEWSTPCGFSVSGPLIEMAQMSTAYGKECERVHQEHHDKHFGERHYVTYRAVDGEELERVGFHLECGDELR